MTVPAPKAMPHRILHTIDTGGPGGAETVLLSVVTGLEEEKWDSQVVVPEVDWLAGRLVEAGQEVVLLPTSGSADIRFLAGLVRQIQSFRPHLVHAHLFTSGVYGSLAASIAGRVPLVCTFHGQTDVSPEDRFLSVKARILSRAANRMVYVSRSLRKGLEPMLGIPSEHGCVIRNGIDFDDTPLDGSEREVLGVPEEAVLVGAVGNVRAPKDYPTLLRAARLVADRFSHAHFVVLGDTRSAQMPQLDRMLDELQLRSRLSFLGFRPDAHRLLKAFDIFVSSSWSEGLPLSVLEAAGAGIPVVLTRCGGPEEIVEHGRTGLLVPPRSPSELAEALAHLIAQPDLAERLATQGKEAVRREFSRAEMVDAYQRLYMRLITTSEPIPTV